MLRKILTICALTFCASSGVQAVEQESPSSFNSFENSQDNQEELLACKKCKKHKKHAIACNEDSKDLSPGLFICNASEDKCVKENDQDEFNSSLLFSVFNDDHQDEINLLACKDCQ